MAVSINSHEVLGKDLPRSQSGTRTNIGKIAVRTAKVLLTIKLI